MPWLEGRGGENFEMETSKTSKYFPFFLLFSRPPCDLFCTISPFLFFPPRNFPSSSSFYYGSHFHVWNKRESKKSKRGKRACVCVWWREKRKHLSPADIQETAAAAALLPFLPNPLLQHSFFFSIYSPPTSISHPPPFFCSDKNQFHSLLNLHFLFLSFFLFPPPPPSLFSSF